MKKLFSSITSSTTEKTSKSRSSCKPLSALQSKWQNFADHHAKLMKNNPFHESYQGPDNMTKKENENWGVPTGKTLERGLKAHAHIENEIQYLLDMILSLSSLDPISQKRFCTFQQIFMRYVRISDKVVGILMRAKKRKLVYFEPEMLWQGRDDDVKIFLLQHKLNKTEPKWLNRKGKQSCPVNSNRKEREELVLDADIDRRKPEQVDLPTSPPYKGFLTIDKTQEQINLEAEKAENDIKASLQEDFASNSLKKKNCATGKVVRKSKIKAELKPTSCDDSKISSRRRPLKSWPPKAQ